MCGFVAAIGPGSQQLDRVTFEQMTRTLIHRGPDQEGFFRDERVAMGFRRLAILDLFPTGHQPMTDDDGRFVLVFNGEIFNFVELRDVLEKRGHRFRSSGDAEVLLTAFKEWGDQCTRRLNGMYAFIIYDKSSGRVFGARDRFGTKPLFYAAVDGCLLIGSEIKALRASALCGREFNTRTVADYLFENMLDNTNETFFAGIEKVPPSTQFWIDVGNPVPIFSRYWNLLDEMIDPPSDPAGQFRDLFENAVGMRMRSDVPVGVSLSGGLDSTSIICSMARQWGSSGTSTDGKLLAFCFQSQEFDESRYIEATLKQTGAVQVQTGTEAMEFWDDLDKVLWFHDEPVNSMTPLVGYRIAELAAANDVKVLLNGQGSDEYLGGYSGHFEHKRDSLVAELKYAQLWRETSEYCAQYGGSVPGIVAQETVKALKGGLQRLPVYGALAKQRRRLEVAGDPWLTEDFKRSIPEKSYEAPVLGLEAKLLNSVTVSPLPIYLRQEDRNSMAHSVEARLPFLDHRLVALAFSLSNDWKVSGRLGKILLREAMRGQIPEIVRARPDKMGFPTPSGTWFRDELHGPMTDLLASKQFIERGVFDVRYVRKSLEEHKQGLVNAADQLFKVAQFEIWAELSNRGLTRAP